MSRDSHSGLQCPHCRTHLVLVPAPGEPVAPGDPPPVLVREEWTPPPVGEVLAQYAHLAIDEATARRGAAKVRDSFNKARQAAAQKRAEQKAARRRAAANGSTVSKESQENSGDAAAGTPPGRSATAKASPGRAVPGSAIGGAAIRVRSA
jgi:hypothetical protein